MLYAVISMEQQRKYLDTTCIRYCDLFVVLNSFRRGVVAVSFVDSLDEFLTIIA